VADPLGEQRLHDRVFARTGAQHKDSHDTKAIVG
jgi:hypothetical protein